MKYLRYETMNFGNFYRYELKHLYDKIDKSDMARVANGVELLNKMLKQKYYQAIPIEDDNTGNFKFMNKNDGKLFGIVYVILTEQDVSVIYSFEQDKFVVDTGKEDVSMPAISVFNTVQYLSAKAKIDVEKYWFHMDKFDKVISHIYHYPICIAEYKEF